MDFHLLTTFDWIALGSFLLCWAGYGWVTEHGQMAERGLIGLSHRHRLRWARQMMKRDNRIADSSLVGNLVNNVSFYANTTIYVIAGLLALLGTLDKLINAAGELPFARTTPRELWELKLLLLIGIFVVAYFKFTWSLRQFNMLSILIGAAPLPGEKNELEIRRVARLNSLAGDEFNRGIRAYYFGLAAVSWFFQPWLFMASTLAIVGILYRRDYLSHTHHALSLEEEQE
ncbi:MAG: DUF599 domain-containing protein [Zoogloea sp.]|nr:DUF599 domain-containing protein [Zoogloea sp.]